MLRTSKKFPGVEWVETTQFITIDTAKCDGCANCIKVCIAECYEIEDKKSKIKNLDYCMECGACWFSCTNDAINFSWPVGGTGFKTKLG